MQQDHAAGVVPPPWTLRGNATVIPFRRGVLAFVRYAESEVGAYDELLWLAPFRRSPRGRAHHVAPIFVSSEASVRGGRANWGLPKELAVFTVSSEGPAEERVEISSAGQPLASFVRHCPRARLPLSLNWVPAWARRLVQVAGGSCFETVPEGRGYCQLTRISELEVNRERLPDACAGRSWLGLYVDDFELRFPAARVTAMR
jgi:hypothetical protein